MIRRPPIATPTDTLFPYPTPFLSTLGGIAFKPGDLPAKDHLGILVIVMDAQGRDQAINRRARVVAARNRLADSDRTRQRLGRSEEHTYELQSLMRISYDVFSWKKITKQII